MTENPLRADARSMARALIRCPSVTPEEGGALAYLESVLTPLGFTVHRQVFSEPGTPDVENLFARLGSGHPHILYAGHTDVVPAGATESWRHDPFGGEISDGFLYGRGAVDMKGSIACFVAAVAAFLDAKGGAFDGAISLLITGDEEGPSINGTKKMLDWAVAHGESFDGCIVGEPTNPNALGDMIKIGRRGSLSGTLTVTGTQGHVAYPHLADNPIRGMTRLIEALAGPPLDAGTEHFQASNLEFTTLDVGNPALNVIPAEAKASFNIRYNDTWTRETLVAELERRLEEAAGNSVRYNLEILPSASDVFRTEAGTLTDLLVPAIEEETGFRPELSTSGGTSDARYIKDVCPVIEFGLVGKTMHQVDERVAVEDLDRLAVIYTKFLERFFS